MGRGTSLTGRAIVAVLLMIVFFALAAGAVLALGFAGFKVMGFAGDLNGRGALLMLLLGLGLVGAAGVVAWSILPRIDRFEPPGPEIDRAGYPALFREIDDLATLTGQRGPRHVYLVYEVNAFVTERGGFMGLGSQRVMGLGLPLLQTVTVGELRAIIAHELGHFHGGDTRLGPWIYKTRGAIGRTIVNLHNATTHAASIDALAAVFGLVQLPFSWFGSLYMRITQAISRAQEYGADALAVQTVGAPALTSGLKKIAGAALAYQVFIRNEVDPLSEIGYMPPIGEGFRLFVAASAQLDEALAKAVDEQLATESQDPFDSHPPLRDRVAAAERLPSTIVAVDDRPAIELVPDVAALDRLLLERLASRTELRPVSWERSGPLLTYQWRERYQHAPRLLKGYTPATLPIDRATVRRLAGPALDDRIGVIPDDVLHDWATGYYGAVLMGMLTADGFEVRNRPGAPLQAVRGELTLEPYRVSGAYVRGELSADAWRAQWTEAGIADRAFERAGDVRPTV